MARATSGKRAVLSLGSNLGDRFDYLARAIGLMTAATGETLLAVSAVYETPPLEVGEDHGPYLNQVLILDTALTAAALLQRCQWVEQELGRPTERTGTRPRTIDIDLISFGAECLPGPGLQLPHPRYRQRRFVLLPLQEVYPDYHDPVTGESIADLLDACKDRSVLRRFTEAVRVLC